VGKGDASPAIIKLRDAENQWIRTTDKLYGVIDFEKMTQDPAHPEAFLPAYDSGDHLHPGDGGYRAMGEGIDLKLFEK
jgi:lysophospholipase L1-like esterase